MSRLEQAQQAFKLSYGISFSPELTQPNENINYWESMKSQLNSLHLPIPKINSLAFLDLGGGSDWMANQEEGDPGFTPFLCRYLAASGAPKVVNIDRGPVNSRIHDTFQHIQLVIKNDDSFSLVEELRRRRAEGPFDIIFSARFADIIDPSPHLLTDISSTEDIYQLVERIKNWAKELLKPGGYLFLYGDNDYIFLNGELVSFRSL